jgi:hypothetical protein
MSDRFDVLERFEPLFEAPEPSFEGFVRRRDRKRRNQRIAAGVVGIAVFVAAVWIVTTGGPFDRTLTPAVTGPTVPPTARVGFVGLPPDGATPSAPERGELVLSLAGRSTTDRGGQLFQNGLPLIRIWVYADGRLIWDKEGDLPEGANDVTTGFLEQRLTPEGVELMRSEIVSTGLFGHDLTLLSRQGVIQGTIQARDGDRLVRVDWSNPDFYPQNRGTVATPEQASALQRLDALLTQPASWLPASAWEDREIKAYVPSMYAVCYFAMDSSVEPSRILSLLPAPAEDLLRGRQRTPYEGWQSSSDIYCSDVTTEEARTLAESLDAAGLHRDENENLFRLDYQLDVPDLPSGRSPVHIYFEPYLPHGEFQR